MLCVKGSGWDMGNIEPQGLPAVRLAPLRRAARAATRCPTRTWSISSAPICSDSTAPNPSVETLLHAFLPHKFIDHTHSTAVLALTDQPDGEATRARALRQARRASALRHAGLRAGQEAVADVFDANPDVEGLILLKHGIFTFGATARRSL